MALDLHWVVYDRLPIRVCCRGVCEYNVYWEHIIGDDLLFKMAMLLYICGGVWDGIRTAYPAS
jgi:hypothetical protein